MITIRLACIAASLILLSGIAAAQQPSSEPVALDIPALPLNDALKQLARQAGIQVVFYSKESDGISAPRITGRFTPQAALTELLAGTALRYEFVNANTVAIRSKSTEGDAFKKTSSMQEESGRQSLVLAQADTPSASMQKVDETEAKKGSKESMEGIPEVLVYGARSLNMDLTRTRDDVQPYYIMDRETLQKSGASSVESFLRDRLTMNTTALTAQQRAQNAGGNNSSVNLRGLGTAATLILIDGRRTTNIARFGDTSQGDLNGIPLAAVDHIEVLPSSAAAIYGGSAIGGVVNVVLKRDFEGGEVRANYETASDGSAPIRTVDAGYGFSMENGRTHALLAAHYSEGDALTLGDRRELVDRYYRTVLRNDPSFIYAPSNPFVGTTPNIGSANGSNLTLRDGTPLNSSITFIPAGVSATTPAATLNASLLANAGRYNLNWPADAVATGLNFTMGSAPKTKSFLASGRREMTDNLTAFVEFSYSNNIADSLFGASGVFSVPASAPSNPFQQNVLVSFLDNASGGRYRVETTSRRVAAGLIVGLPGNWKAQADYTWNSGESNYGTAYLYSLGGRFSNGTLNPFVDTVANPLVLTNYRGSIGYEGPVTLKDMATRFAGPLWQMPGGATMLTVGLEHRKESVDDQPFFRHFPLANDPLAIDLLYLSRNQKTDSLYAEMKLPLVSSKNARPGLYGLDFQIAARTERYSINTGTSNINLAAPSPTIIRSQSEFTSTDPTIGLRYRPIESVMFRASFGKAFLPPTFSQLAPAPPDPFGLTISVVDPRRGNAVTAVQRITGGNPSLDPTTSENWNAGLIFEPTFAPGLRLGVEWYRIHGADVIISPTAQQVVNNESALPGRVTRGTAAPGDPFGVGAITLVNFSAINVNELQVEGIDAALDYLIQTDHRGIFSFSGLASFPKELNRQIALGTPLENIVNRVSDGGPLDIKANTTLSWDFRNWRTSWTSNYYSSYLQNTGAAPYGLGSYVIAQGSRRIPSQLYHSLLIGYEIPAASEGGANDAWYGRALAATRIQLVIKNIFNTIPPVDVFYPTQGSYISPFADPRLRTYALSVTKNF